MVVGSAFGRIAMLGATLVRTVFAVWSVAMPVDSQQQLTRALTEESDHMPRSPGHHQPAHEAEGDGLSGKEGDHV